MRATKTRFHKLTAWLLTLAMIMTLMPGFTLGVSAETSEAKWGADADNLTNQGTIDEAFAAANADGSTVGYIQLQKDATMITSPKTNNDMTLDMQGYVLSFSNNATITASQGTLNLRNGTIKRAEADSEYMITAGEDSILNIENVTLDGGAVWSGDEDSVLGRGTTNSGITAHNVLLYVRGTATLNEGTVLQNNQVSSAPTNGSGGAVTVFYGGSLTINDGVTIRNNENPVGSGGAIKAYRNSSIVMNGGDIYGNAARDHGGAIQIIGKSADQDLTTFTMNGGTIRNNRAGIGKNTAVGGAIAVSDYSKFIMTGGSITDNTTAGTKGGGVSFSDENTAMELSDSAVIIGNTANGVTNNLYIGDKSNNKVTVGAMVGEDSVGITMATPGTFSDGGASYASCFFSDDNTYTVAMDGDDLKLAEPSPTETHSHPICGDNECADHGEDIAWTEWTSTNSLPTSSGNYYLTDDVTIGSRWEPKNGIVLCLNGYSIIMTGNNDVIKVGSNVTFTLTDCGATGTITHASGATGRGASIYGGTFNMYGGSITGNSTNNNGGGVLQNTGTFNMYGGSITGNTAEYDGGGVHMEYATFNMYDGSITSNSAGKDGGGANLEDSSVKFNMSGGSITGNSAAEKGGGVYVYNGTFTVSGGPKIIDNTKGTGTDVTKNNLHLSSGKKVTVSELSVDARIGITMQASAGGAFTSGWSTHMSSVEDTDISGYFTSDSNNFTVQKGNNELNLVSAVVSVSGVELNKESTTLTVGGTETLTATVAPDNATNKAVTWGSNNESVATVAGGIVSAVGEGTATITVTTADGGKTDTCIVTVLAAHEHPICGTACSHNGEHSSVPWKPIGTKDELTGINEAGYYYLTTSIDLGYDTWKPADGVVLDLCGKTLSGSGTYMIRLDSNVEFTVTDCRGTGSLSHTYPYECYTVYTPNDTSGAVFNLYNGSIESNGYAYCDWYGNKFNQYGGSIASGYSMTVFVQDGAGEYNLFGGSVTNTSTSASAIAVCVRKGSTKLTMSGDVEVSGPIGILVTNPITIADALEKPSAPYTIYTADTSLALSYFVFTEGWDSHMSAADPTDYFAATTYSPGYVAAKTSEGELMLAENPEVTYTTDGGETWKFDSLMNAIWEYGADVEIKLLRNITLTSESWSYAPVFVNENSKVTIDGQGYKITLGDGVDIFATVGEENSTLTLKNITIDGGAVWNGDNPATRTNSGYSANGYYYLFDVYNGTLILDEGAVIQNAHLTNANSYGSAVTVQQTGALVMNEGAKIKDCTAGQGGAVCVVSSTASFTMNGGEISGCYAASGGGAVIAQGNFTMNGGEISGNASGNNGGGVTVSTNGIFTLNDGAIINNASVAGGGAITVLASNSVVNIKGGSIKENTITGTMGGGILVNNGSLTVSGNPKVRGNTINGTTASNIYLVSGKTISINGALTDGAELGITTGTTPTADTPVAVTGENNADYSRHFSSDKSGYDVVNNNNTLYLVIPTEEYSITFDANGGTAVSNQTVNNGGKVEEPATPLKTGYTFAGWYKDIGLTTAWDFDTDSVTEPVTLYAKWAANTDTPYVVKHWVQTLDAAINGRTEKNDSNYTLSETENLTGTTDSSFKADTKEIEGFTAPDKETITIAADGSTVHNYYYTRNKYNIVINTDDGVATYSGGGQYYYEQAVEISASLKSGYKWTEWTANETGYGSSNILYSFNMPAKALVLSPKTTSKSEVEINTGVQNYTYDKSEKAFEIKGTNLAGFTVSYEQNGVSVTPANAGVYDVKITRAENSDYKAYSKTIPGGLVINKAIVNEPVIESKVYNGENQSADIDESNLYIVTSNEGRADVGTANVVLTLLDSTNYKWNTNDDASVTLTFTVAPQKVTKPAVNTTVFTYTGSEQTYELTTDARYEITGNKRTNAGTQTVTVALKDNANYTWIDGTTADVAFTFTIAPKSVEGATVGTFAAMTYTENAQTPVATVTIDGLTATGTWSDVTNVEDTTTFTASGNFTGTITNQSTGMAKAIPVVTAPIGKIGLVYDTTAQSLANAGSTTGGTIQYSIDNASWSSDVPTGTSAGDYTLYYKVVGDVNYNDVSVQSISVNIAKADMSSDVTANGYNGVFDNQAHTIGVNIPEGASVKYGIADGTYDLDAAPLYTDAGTYTVYYKAEKENYDAVTGSAYVVITAKDIASAEITLGEALIFNDAAQMQTITNATVDGLTITYDVSGNENTNAGDYTLTITGNGNFMGTAQKAYTIAKATPAQNPEKPTKARVRRGNTLANATVTNGEFFKLDNATVLEGTFAWIDDTEAISEDVTKRMKFTPNDANYAEIEFDVAVDSYTSGGVGGTTRYTVKFDTDGGSKVANATVTKNAKVTEPEAPEKEGYTFGGWYTEAELTTAYDFDTKVTKSFTLYAKWIEIEKEPEGTDTHNCPSEEFADLDTAAWYHLDTDYVIENGIFKGTTENIFEPNTAQTRAMMVTVLYRAEGEPAVNKSIPFADVDMGAYYANAVIWAKQNGIVKGVSETEFAPDSNITREQIAAIMHRYAQYKGYDVSVGENTNILSYDDSDSISEYATASMQWACGSGLIKGKTESTLNPLDNATRAEIAAILHRFLEANK